MRTLYLYRVQLDILRGGRCYLLAPTAHDRPLAVGERVRCELARRDLWGETVDDGPDAEGVTATVAVCRKRSQRWDEAHDCYDVELTAEAA